jgi:hypothetical protein
MGMERRVAAKGTINTRNLLTIVSVGILVGTELIGVALAAGWAIAGLLQLGDSLGRTVEYGLMTVFVVVGAYGLFRFMQRAVTVEPIRD